MDWIVDKSHFDDVFLKAKTCVYTDSGRLPTSLKKLIFDDAEAGTTRFADMLQQLLVWSGDPYFSYVVLEPDPRHYFHRLFGAFPVIEVERGTPAKEYIKGLNKGPEGSPSDGMGTNYAEYAIFPPSMRWFVHAMRSDLDNGGHLWIPKDMADRVMLMYPYLSAAPAT